MIDILGSLEENAIEPKSSRNSYKKDIDISTDLEHDELNATALQTLHQKPGSSEQPIDSGISKLPFTKCRTRMRTRLVLPIIVSSDKEAVEVTTCPDSGSEENIISLEFVDRLGLKLQESGHESTRFSIANGKIVESIGQVSAQCSFVASIISDSSALDCIFHVFHSLAVPVIMGMNFLEQTETLNKHKDRLVEELVPAMQSLRVTSIGKPRRNIICRLGTYVGCAVADTGSDLDLVSPEFARSRAFNIQPACEELQFADCSFGYTSGIIRTSFSIGNLGDGTGFLPRGNVVSLEFFVLDSLNADILVGHKKGTMDDS